MKNLIKKILAPTPDKIRRIGTAMLTTCTASAGGGLIAFDTLKQYFSQHEMKILIGIIMGMGVLGKIITSLYVKKDDGASK